MKRADCGWKHSGFWFGDNSKHCHYGFQSLVGCRRLGLICVWTSIFATRYILWKIYMFVTTISTSLCMALTFGKLMTQTSCCVMRINEPMLCIPPKYKRLGPFQHCPVPWYCRIHRQSCSHGMTCYRHGYLPCYGFRLWWFCTSDMSWSPHTRPVCVQTAPEELHAEKETIRDWIWWFTSIN